MVRPTYPIEMLVAAVRKQSAGRLACELVGPAAGVAVSSIGSLTHALPHEVAFLANPKFRHEVKDCKAGVIVLRQEDKDAIYGEETPRAMIICPDPYAWFAYALQVVDAPSLTFTPGVAVGAHVDESAEIDPTARIEAGATVAARAKIGAGVFVGSGAFVGPDAVIGEGTRLHANVTVNKGCKIGRRCILQSGAVIGADGFGFAPFEGEWVKIPQIGAVTIGDDVEIGANTCVDRGALEDTVIGDGCKLDNLIQIAHNVKMGKHCVMAGCVTVAGSVTIGDHVIFGGRAVINGHITIPSNVTVGPATNIVSWEKDAKMMMGIYPAQPNRDSEKSAVLLKKLPELRRRIMALEAKLEALEQTK